MEMVRFTLIDGTKKEMTRDEASSLEVNGGMISLSLTLFPHDGQLTLNISLIVSHSYLHFLHCAFIISSIIIGI